MTNIWIPDGYKDTPADRQTPRRLLMESLDKVLAEQIAPFHNLDLVEPKLFGIGSESYVVGSMEFYTAYALSRKILLTLDSGHFHPTETIADKISSLLIYLDQLLLHVSRGVRWDSDHVVTLTMIYKPSRRRSSVTMRWSVYTLGLIILTRASIGLPRGPIGSRNTLRARSCLSRAI